jgi:hypothetical protein
MKNEIKKDDNKINKYIVNWFSLGTGKYVSVEVSAENEEQAIFIADSPVAKPEVRLVKDGESIIKDIPDAEELLYEMDINGIDEITIKEGISCKKITYTRDVIEKSLGLRK